MIEEKSSNNICFPKKLTIFHLNINEMRDDKTNNLSNENDGTVSTTIGTEKFEKSEELKDEKKELENIKNTCTKEKENTIEKKEQIKNNEKNEIIKNNNSKEHFLNKNLNPNSYNGINKNILLNQVKNNIFKPYFPKNYVRVNETQNTPNIYNFINNYNIYNQYLVQITQQKKLFQTLRQIGLSAIQNPKNVNNYLLRKAINNNLGGLYNSNNINQLHPFNNLINYNYYGRQNQYLNNFIQNQNFININNNTLNNLNNISGQENYTLIVQSNTNNPEVKKNTKIKVTTSYVKNATKNKPKNNDTAKEKNTKNIINLDDIRSGKETRTVVRLNPIPPNYSSFDVSKLIDKYLVIESGKNQRIYKALYTPLCKKIGKNLGYCFIMMAKPEYVIEFYNTFNKLTFQKKKCKKPCNVIWADIQGEEFLKTNEDDPIRKPIIFKDIKTD
jgi:hypothetical protein